jgi:Flp pilus assembly protein TadG
MFLRYFRNFCRDRRGNIAILSTVMITSLVGVSGLVAEFGNGLLNRMQDQRVADAAALAGGTVFSSTASATSMQAAVNNIATLNGISTGAIASSVVTSPSGDGNQAVQVTVNTSVPLFLSRVLYAHNTLPISVSSYAELESGAPGCIMALSQSGSGVTLSGGTNISAAQCAVTSNTTVSVPCGTYITTKQVMYDTTLSQGCNGIQAPSGETLSISKGLSTDPFAGLAAVSGAVSRLTTVAAITAPTAPGVTGGTAVTFGYTTSTTQNQLSADGCSGTFSSNTWTVTCVGSNSYKFGTIQLSGGITVNFNLNGSALNTYAVNGQICDNGTALHFGNGTYNISGGIADGGGSNTSFGYGTYNIGAISSASNPCGATTGYSIYHVGSIMTLGNSTTASTFNLTGGIDNSGGETLVLGASCTNGSNACTGTSSSNTFTSATGNTFNIGPATNGDALDMGGGASTYLGDSTGNNFEMAGNLNVSSGGGSCLWIGASPEHDIKGFLATAGGNTLGAGLYTVTKYVALGGSGGGDVTCGGSTVGMNGNGVTFVIGGTGTYSSSCAGVSSTAFCVAAGYNHVTLVAPGSGNSTQGFVVIGPTTSANTSPASFGEGASSTSVSGAFYFPYGAISLSGGATLGNGSSQCLMLIGSQVTLSGGTAVASTCNIPGYSGSGSTGAVALVQ